MGPDWSILRAHTRAQDGRQDLLKDHLLSVARLSAQFAATFHKSELAYLIGALHDIGKVFPEFQNYLQQLEAGEEVQQGPPHAIWGAAVAYYLVHHRLKDEEKWKELCLPVAGHHTGIHAAGALSPRLDALIQDNPDEFQTLLDAFRDGHLQPQRFNMPAVTGDSGSREMSIRMILSTLTDADFLATEAHFNPKAADIRPGWPSIPDLCERFELKQAEFLKNPDLKPSVVNSIRREVFQHCQAAGALEPGIFRLTVPTGGGKTRSGLAFALTHARRRTLNRIVVALPYTSITDQTAKVYREILGDDAVVEHHSQVPVTDEESAAPEQLRLKFATENWDAPVIVTTTIQLFESLFSNRPSRVRKLHNLSKAVIILDEVQTLPTQLLRTTLDSIRLLVRDYGTTVVLCTATQPAFHDTPYLDSFKGFNIHEIVPDCERHFVLLRRVEYELRERPSEWSDLANEIANEPQTLVILNTRRDALLLLTALHELEVKHVVHLSTLLCGAHRRHVLENIGKRLKGGQDIRAICTQVIEAGVDVDFPIVYRAMGPLDRIVQAAGRCNREGKPELGRVVLFEPADGKSPQGSYRKGIEQARLLLQRNPVSELHKPALYHEYFQRLFSYEDLDKERIEEHRAALDFPEVARRYRFIKDTTPVVVLYQNAQEKLDRWQSFPSRSAWRALQPYMVNVYDWEIKNLEKSGWLEPRGDKLLVWWGKYDELRGMVPGLIDPADLII